MPGLTPSSPINASSTARGLVTTAAQAFAGVKTFLAAAVFSAGVQLSLLFGTNGSGSADVVIKAGTTLADASVNAGAKIFSVRTGLGGTEVEKFAVTPAGIDLFQGAEINFRDVWGLRIYAQSGYIYLDGPAWCSSMIAAYGISSPSMAYPLSVSIYRSDAAGASDVAVKVGTSVADATVNAAHKLLSVWTGIGGTEVEKFAVEKRGVYVNDILEVGGGSGTRYMNANVVLTMNSTTKTWLFNAYNNGGHVMSLTRLGRFSLGAPVASDAQGSTAVVRTQAGYNETALRVEGLNGQSASLLVLRKNADTTPVTVREVTPEGQTYIKGVVSGTIGNDTKNAAAGTNTLASGATSVTITNSLVTTTTPVSIDFHADPGGRYWVTRSAGSFTVNVSAAPGANAPFSWEVKGLM